MILLNADLPWHCLLMGFLMHGAFGACPSPDPRDSLPKWSDATTWTPGSKPAAGSNVTISSVILLDESASLSFVTIEPTGGLIWSPKVDLDLSVNYIYVGGRFELGSEGCPLTTQTTITLKGNRGDFPGLSGGEKGIICGPNSTCEVHGRPKRSWTKVAETIKTIQENEDVRYNHKETTNVDIRSDVAGLVAYTFALDTVANSVTVKDFGVFDLKYYSTNPESHLNEKNNLLNQLQGLVDGDVFMLATQKYFRLSTKYDPTDVYEEIEKQIHGSVTNNLTLRTIGNDGDTYAMVFCKGEANSLVEVTNSLGTGSVAEYRSASIPDGLTFIASVEGNTAVAQQYDNFYVATYNAKHQLIRLVDDVSTWREGDTVVVTSTDYDFKQAEERIVVACPTCAVNEIRVSTPLIYNHYGEIYLNVDMRGEVACLTRNIKIRGETQSTCPAVNGNCGIDYVEDEDQFGGQIKVLPGNAHAHFEYAEFEKMGQQTDVGNYPLHFHMNSQGTPPLSVPYVKGNAIHHTFARCVTIHSSEGVQVIDNVCYLSRGHSFFLEDGGEKKTRMDGNIAISTLQGSGRLEPTDATFTASFWITNPQTYFENNVAAGGQKFGIWIIFPDIPMEPSTPLGLMKFDEAKRTRLYSLTNNVVHSYISGGFVFKQSLTVNRTMEPGNKYQPHEDPNDPTSMMLNYTFERITCFKNSKFNIWIEGGQLILRKCSSAHSTNGVIFTNQGVPEEIGEMYHNVILGDSNNKGFSSTPGYEGSFPFESKKDIPQKGYLFWRGPTKVYSNWFGNYANTIYYPAAALGHKDGTAYFANSYNQVEDLYFNYDDATGGNRVMNTINLDGPLSEDAVKTGIFRDIDGVLTGTPASQVVPNMAFVTETGGYCRNRTNWDMAVCTNRFGAIRSSQTNFILVRDDYPGSEMSSLDLNDGALPVVLGSNYTYTMHYIYRFPDMGTHFFGLGVEPGFSFRIGFCVPLNAVIKIESEFPYNLTSADDFIQVDSLSKLDASDVNDGKKYYYDNVTGMLYFKFVTNIERDLTKPIYACPDNKCPHFKIKMLSGNYTDGDCRTRLYGANRASLLPPSSNLTFDDVLPKNNKSSSPPEGWGAGSTFPFVTESRQPVNGGYGSWSDWTECSDGTKSRFRMCEDPMPQNGGADCSALGEAYESENCTPATYMTETIVIVMGAPCVENYYWNGGMCGSNRRKMLLERNQTCDCVE